MNREQLTKELRDKGVDTEKLGVALIAGDMIFGEFEKKDLSGEWMFIKNPKRFLRLQQMTNQGVVTNYMIGDLDMVEAGTMAVRPIGVYFLEDISEGSQESMLSLYANFLQRKMEATAIEAGLVLPDRIVRPTK